MYSKDCSLNANHMAPTNFPLKQNSIGETNPSIFEYSTDFHRNAVLITGVKDKTLTYVAIPEKIEGKDVFMIEDSAFRGCQKLQGAIISMNVVEIASRAFADCPMLKKVVLKSPKIRIRLHAFENCGSLETLEFTSAVRSEDIALSAEAFINTRLPFVNYKGGKYLSVGNNGYFALMGPENVNVTKCELHNSTAIIADDAFENCASLVSLDLRGNVTTVPLGAFRGCSALKDIVFGSNIKTVSYGAFDNCTSLVRAVLPGVNEISGFEGCSALQTIVAPFANRIYSRLNSNVIIDRSIFDPKVLTYEVDEKKRCIAITGIKDKAVTSVSIPEQIENLPVKIIRERAFYGCTNLQVVTFSKNVCMIYQHAFENCTSLRRVTFNSPELMLVPLAFENCTALDNVEFTSWESGAKVSVSSNAFYGTKIPVSVYKGGTYLTMNGNPYFALLGPEAANTKRCEVHPNCEFMMESAFKNHKSLEQLVLEGKITTVPLSAFEGCKSLSAVVFGNNIKFVVKDAFNNCTSLRRVSLPSAEFIDGFDGCRSLQVVEAPSVKVIQCTFAESTKLVQLVIGPDITEIANHAFVNCRDLHAIDFAGIEISWKQCYSNKAVSGPINTAHQIKKVNCSDGTVRLHWF